MEEDPPTKGKGRALNSIGLLVLFLVVVTAISFALKPPPNEPGAVFLHPDGQLSLGRRDGKKFPPSAIESWPLTEGQAMSDHFVLDAPPETPASKWFETISQLASRGYASYQLRSADEAINFHIPDLRDTIYSTRTEPKWIDLRRGGGEKPKLRQMFDVVILVDDSVTCGEILAAIQQHRIPGTSLRLTNSTFEILRTKTEDFDHEPPKHSLADRIRSAFRP